MGLQIFQSAMPLSVRKLTASAKSLRFPILDCGSGVPASLQSAARQGQGRGLAQFFFYGLYPIGQAGDFLPNIPQQVIGLSYPAVEIALVGGDIRARPSRSCHAPLGPHFQPPPRE